MSFLSLVSFSCFLVAITEQCCSAMVSGHETKDLSCLQLILLGILSQLQKAKPMLGNCPGHCTLPPTSTHSQPLPPSQAEQLCCAMENAPQNTRGGLSHPGLGLFLATLTASSGEKCSEVSGFLCPVFGGAFCFCLQVLGSFLSSYQNGWGRWVGRSHLDEVLNPLFS